jgi:hypothetical protein
MVALIGYDEFGAGTIFMLNQHSQHYGVVRCNGLLVN